MKRKDKVYPTKEELYNLLISQNLTNKDIAEIYSISLPTVSKLIKQYDIHKSKEAIHKLAEDTWLKKYGVDNPAKSKDIYNKIEKTVSEKYGVKCALQTVKRKPPKPKVIKPVKVKLKKTPMSKEERLEKIRSTNLKKYGVEYPFQSKEIQEKVQNTFMKKYGVDNLFSSKEIQDKIKETNVKKYGYENPMSCKEVFQKKLSTMEIKYNAFYPIQNASIKAQIEATNISKYGVKYYCLIPDCYKKNNGTDSKPNLMFKALLEEANLEYSREYQIDSYRYDFKVGDTLFEIDPVTTHNTTIPYRNSIQISPDYHFQKSSVAIKNGLHCVHIFDWDDYKKVISIFSKKDRIYARQCIVQEVSKADCDAFLLKYHLQGSCQGQAIRLGLYYKDQLVSIMTFGKPRYNKKYQYELLRFANGEYSVIGGASKLYTYFKKKYDPESIISYCDNSKFTGEVYKNLGMTLLEYGKPSKHWITLHGKYHTTDNLLRQRGFDQLFGSKFGYYGKGTSNEELMRSHGFVEVYDCGQSVYYFKK